jgi:hypothetical protein
VANGFPIRPSVHPTTHRNKFYNFFSILLLVLPLPPVCVVVVHENVDVGLCHFKFKCVYLTQHTQQANTTQWEKLFLEKMLESTTPTMPLKWKTDNRMEQAATTTTTTCLVQNQQQSQRNVIIFHFIAHTRVGAPKVGGWMWGR